VEVASVDVDSETLDQLVELCRIGSLEERDEATASIRTLIEGPASEYKNFAEHEGLLDGMVAVLRGGSDDARVNAAACMRGLARVEENKKNMCNESGLVEGLVTMARLDGEKASAQAVAALANLATSPYTREAIGVTDGAVRVLAVVLRDGNDEGRLYAAGALGNLAWQHPANSEQIGRLTHVFTSLSKLLLNEGPGASTTAASALANLAIQPDNHQAMAAQPIVEALASHLDGETSPQVTLHCADALAELSNDEAVAPMVLSTEGVLEGLVALARRGLSLGDQGAAGSAAYVLSGLAVNGGDRMQLVCTEGLVAALASIVTHGDAQSKADAVCALWELMQHPEAPYVMSAVSGLLPALEGASLSPVGELKDVAMSAVAKLKGSQ